MSTWANLLEQAKPQEHVVQLYGEDDQLLVRNVSRYLLEGLRQGDGMLVVATADHSASIVRQLANETSLVAEAVQGGRLVMADAGATLERLMAEGRPDQQLFRTVLEPMLDKVRECTTTGKVRAFGEMVGLLWARGERYEAIRLEEFWNELLKGSDFSLYCAYPIDIFSDCFQMSSLTGVLAAHTHTFAGPKTLLSRQPAVAQQ